MLQIWVCLFDILPPSPPLSSFLRVASMDWSRGNDRIVHIQDTAGQERFSSLSSAFYRGADAAILMFDVTRPSTLTALEAIWEEFCDKVPLAEDAKETFCCVFVGNKIDVPEVEGKDRVTRGHAMEFIDKLIPPNPPPVVSQSSSSQHTIPNTSSSPKSDSSQTNEHRSLRDCLSIPITPSVDIDIRTLSRSECHSGHNKSRSRSSTRLGTWTETVTSIQTFHTASSSVFDSDAFTSALSSPVGSLNSSAAWSHVGRGSVRWKRRRYSGTWSSSHSESGETITPSMYRAAATARQSLSSSSAGDSRRNSRIETAITTPTPSMTPLPPPPLKRPALFFTSAKSGEGVREVFDYITARVVRKWEWEEALEARVMDMSEDEGGPSRAERIRLGRVVGWDGESAMGHARCCS
jgi:Ras-related protein Rab-7A